MTGSEIAALIAAVGGAIGAIAASMRNLRSDKFKHEVEASSSLLAGYGTMVTTLQAQIENIEERHARDRAEWVQREKDLREQFEAALRERDERIDELGTQVYVLQNRPPELRTREADHG